MKAQLQQTTAVITKQTPVKSWPVLQQSLGQLQLYFFQQQTSLPAFDAFYEQIYAFFTHSQQQEMPKIEVLTYIQISLQNSPFLAQCSLPIQKFFDLICYALANQNESFKEFAYSICRILAEKMTSTTEKITQNCLVLLKKQAFQPFLKCCRLMPLELLMSDYAFTFLHMKVREIGFFLLSEQYQAIFDIIMQMHDFVDLFHQHGAQRRAEVAALATERILENLIYPFVINSLKQHLLLNPYSDDPWLVLRRPGALLYEPLAEIPEYELRQDAISEPQPMIAGAGVGGVTTRATGTAASTAGTTTGIIGTIGTAGTTTTTTGVELVEYLLTPQQKTQKAAFLVPVSASFFLLSELLANFPDLQLLSALDSSDDAAISRLFEACKVVPGGGAPVKQHFARFFQTTQKCSRAELLHILRRAVDVSDPASVNGYVRCAVQFCDAELAQRGGGGGSSISTNINNGDGDASGNINTGNNGNGDSNIDKNSNISGTNSDKNTASSTTNINATTTTNANANTTNTTTNSTQQCGVGEMIGLVGVAALATDTIASIVAHASTPALQAQIERISRVSDVFSAEISREREARKARVDESVRDVVEQIYSKKPPTVGYNKIRSYFEEKWCGDGLDTMRAELAGRRTE